VNLVEFIIDIYVWRMTQADKCKWGTDNALCANNKFYRDKLLAFRDTKATREIYWD
jgi:hypothetical protein